MVAVLYRRRAWPSSAFLGLAGSGLVKALQDAVPVIVERQAERHDDRQKRDRVDVLLLGDVGAEVRGDHRARQTPDRRDDREDPEGHRADPEEIGDDVLREPRDQIEDEADDRALGFEDEVQPVPVVLAEPRTHERLAPLPPDPEAEERADRQADRRVDHAEPRPEEHAADGARDFARDGRDDDLQRLDRDEHERRHPPPRPHRLLEEMLVLVESDHPVDEGGLRGDEPDDERQRRSQARRPATHLPRRPAVPAATPTPPASSPPPPRPPPTPGFAPGRSPTAPAAAAPAPPPCTVSAAQVSPRKRCTYMKIYPTQ